MEFFDVGDPNVSVCPPPLALTPPPRILIDWLSECFADLAEAGQITVEAYWQELRTLGRHQPYYQKVTLGVRLRLRPNGNFSLEWFLMTRPGTTPRPVTTLHVPKGRQHTHYPVKRLMRRQPPCLWPLVEKTEAALGEIRLRQARLVRLRDALGDYLKLDGGPSITGGRLIEAYRMGEVIDLEGLRIFS